MGNGNLRSTWATLTALVLVAAFMVGAAPAQADEDCYYDPVTGRLVCEDDGGGGGETGTTGYWTSWRIIGTCGGGGVGGIVVDIRTGLILALRDYIVDGEVAESQSTCIDLDDAAEEIWTEVASAAAALPDPGWEASPDGVISKGLTGLETWLWYSNPSQVGPIDATWTDPVTGLVFGVRGRGWTESITLDTGQGRYDVFAPTWDDAPAMGGSQDAPAATHFYNTTSAAAGYPNGYPVSVEVYWVGEYRVRVIAGVWTGWARLASTLTEVYPGRYEVVEVRSKLSG
ncbi:MAG TPA: hypothetical protein ENH00_06035 [Actinobacteria bacterium]|nr:hypothetical protein BMS3Bbin01_02446 [bacterium BMS3Bbin01]HDH25737.1 hypothetical protein [Actinomycetota bacterium]